MRSSIYLLGFLISANAYGQSLSNLRQPSTMPVAVQPATEPVEPEPERGTFIFGSYGRASVFTNQLGRAIPDVNAVGRVPRLEKRSYIELYLGYEKRLPFGTFNVQITPAFAGDPFHYTGQFRADFALRNAFVDISNIGGVGLFAWGGSRMYRGDDVYLLDFWALDDLNTLGGGFGWRGGGFEIAAHAGANRVLGTNFFQQQIVVADPRFGIGTTEVEVNNRQRLIGSLKLSYYRPLGDVFAFKLKAYLEGHSIGEGAIQVRNQATETLPGDSGYVLGGQVSLFQQNTRNYWHLFLRYGHNLGAFGSLQVPIGLNNDRTTAGARDLLLSTSLNLFFWERLGLVFGGYYRTFHSPQGGELDQNGVDELTGAVRANIAILRYFQQSVELSAQRTYPRGIQPDILRQISPALFKFSLMPALVSGPENFPDFALRLIYTYTTTNEDTRYLYAPEDVRYVTRSYHFFGLQAEWLFEVRL